MQKKKKKFIVLLYGLKYLELEIKEKGRDCIEFILDDIWVLHQLIFNFNLVINRAQTTKAVISTKKQNSVLVLKMPLRIDKVDTYSKIISRVNKNFISFGKICEGILPESCCSKFIKQLSLLLYLFCLIMLTGSFDFL